MKTACTSCTAWYCARTKAKHEHIAAAILWKNLCVETFNPRLRIERATRRGVVKVNDPLFPGYIFVRCVLEEKLGEIQHAGGIVGLVRCGDRVAEVPDAIIDELKASFLDDDPLPVENCCAPGDEVAVLEGVFREARGSVLRVMPARQRVLVLLEILGRPMPVELDLRSVVRERSLAELVPALAAASREETVIFG